MTPNQGQGQLADLVCEGFETLVFRDPCSDLAEHVLGHVDRACLAIVLKREVMGDVQRTIVMAGTRRLAAAFADLTEAGGKDGTGWRELLESAGEHPANLRRVTRHTHGRAPETSGKYLFYREWAKKSPVRRNYLAGSGASARKIKCKLNLRYRQGATNSLFLTAVEVCQGIFRAE